MFFNKKINEGGKTGFTQPSTAAGFTLIELLVVIAIIGILSSVVLASLNSALEKSRDAKRVADLNQVKLALELYLDDNNSTYPATLAPLVTGGYIPVIPLDPNGGAYSYAGLGGSTCTDYHLGATLENAANPAFDNDSDAAAGTACSGSAADFAGTEPIYDLKP